MLPVTEAVANIPWLPMRVIVSRAVRHRGCGVYFARWLIIEEGKAGRIKACGLTVEGWPMSLLSAAWYGVDGDVNVDLRLDGRIAADLLPAPAEQARWSAVPALAYIIAGMPLEEEEWTPEMMQQLKQAEIDLGQAIGAGQVPAWGRRSRYGPFERIPGGDFRTEKVAMNPLASTTCLPKVVVCADGNLGVSPAYRIADYRGSYWFSIECDSARLKQAFPKPLRVERWVLNEAEQLYAEGGSEPALPAEPPQSPPTESAPAPPVELPLHASTVEKIVWAYLRLRVEAPDQLRLHGDALRNVVYRRITPSFTASLRSWNRAMAEVRELDPRAASGEQN
jgi:hypothetical protein